MTTAAPGAAPVPVHPFRDVRLHVVTGKGGTGKTTVAAALAVALASGGHRVLLAEVEGRQGVAQVFDSPPLPYEERKVASAPGGGEVFALALDAEDALLDYLELFYGMKRAGRALKRFGVVDFATTIAPGMRDVLLTGKVKEAVTRTDKASRPVYDAVVMDAPPTGRITRFLNVTSEVVGLARSGPVRSQAEGVVRVIRSPATAVHLVTILEEMPVQETIDGVTELTANGLPVGSVIVNMARDPLMSPDDVLRAAAGAVPADEIAPSLAAAGLSQPEALAGVLVAEVGDHARRVELETRARRELVDLGRPIYDLPLLADGVDVGALYLFAEKLREQGMTG